MVGGMRVTPALLAVLLVAGLIGCSSKQSYDVTVMNRSPQPVTLWLTKNGPPGERGWYPPEQLAFLTKTVDDGSVPGAWLEPGKTAGIGPIEGKFSGQTKAILRVYRGRLKFNELIAVSDDSPLREDLILRPGKNVIAIDRTGAIVREPTK